MSHVVYGLTDPRDGRIRYVGQTGRFEQRLKDHRASRHRRINGGADLLAWLTGLSVDCGAVVLELASTRDAAKEAEARWIRDGLRFGWPLVNVLKRGNSRAAEGDFKAA